MTVDTAALAVHLRCTPSHVRKLTSAGIISPAGTRRVKARGRPSNAYNLDDVDAAIEAARLAGRIELDHGHVRVRN